MLRVTFREPTLLSPNKEKTIECNGLRFNDRVTKEYIICQFDGVEVFRFKYKYIVSINQINPVTKEVLKHQ